MPITAIHFDTKSRLAYEAIKASVIEGTYRPGQKIGISDIAKRLHTSDIPVREAMQRLEAEGLLQYTPHVGFRVTSPDFDKYTDVYDVRQILEGEAAGRAARKITAEQMASLKSLHADMVTAARDGAFALFSDLNRQFHAVIFDACDNPVLTRQIEQVGAIYPRTHAIFVMFPERTVSAIREHEEIIRRIEAGDADAAKKAYLDHMAGGYELLLQHQQTTEKVK